MVWCRPCCVHEGRQGLRDVCFRKPRLFLIRENDFGLQLEIARRQVSNHLQKKSRSVRNERQICLGGATSSYISLHPSPSSAHRTRRSHTRRHRLSYPKARFPLSHEGALRRRSEVTQVEAWERWVLRRVGVEPVRKRPQPHTVLTRRDVVSIF